VSAATLAALMACAPGSGKANQPREQATDENPYRPSAQRVVDCHNPPERKPWTGRSEEPVETCFGPNTFMIAMHYFTDQAGPDFQGSVSLTFLLPDLRPRRVNESQEKGYRPTRSSVEVRGSITYVNRRPIETLLPEKTFPRPDQTSRYGSVRDDLRQRIQGAPVFDGLVPYWANLDKLREEFVRDGVANPREEQLVNWGDDWYVAFDDDGKPVTHITCDNRALPMPFLHGENFRPLKADDPIPRPSCRHHFVMEHYSLAFSLSYSRAYLPYWKQIEARFREVIESSRVVKEGSQ
ncbi:MAG: hypothetical protein Q4G46_15430, partial [Propionibacteriaceae bacterium]|nr:hypothetical protein [Propionibacteriaceae bacterium]